MAIVKKQLIVNVYNPADGSFIATWANIDFKGFTKELNGGPGECILKLDKVFDYGGLDLKLGNEVELRISDKDTNSTTTPGEPSKTIYRGYISMIEREVDGVSESIIVHLLGFYTLLGVDILKSGSQTTLYSKAVGGLTTVVGDQGSADIGLMMRAVIDRYRAENPTNPKISYDSENIPNTGTVAMYSFRQKTYREAIDLLKKLAPAGVYYYIDENGSVKFKAKSATTIHQFIFGRHFNKVRIETTIEKLRNFFVIWNGETGAPQVYKHYKDDESISLYGRRAYAANDYGIDNVNAANLIGGKFIDEAKQPEIKVVCEIFDNNENENFGYDIESIQPGDTCSFYGFSSDLDEIFRDNMIITQVNYSLDKVELQIETIKAGILDFQEQQEKKINDIGTGGLNIPESYT